MRTSVVPELIDALLAAAKDPVEALDARVEDGYGTSDADVDVLHIGVDDPFSASRADSADVGEVPGPGSTERPRDETGSIRCAALASDGAGEAKVARDKVYALAATLATIVRTASGPGVPMPAFGIEGLRDVGYGVASTFYQNQSTTGGAEALLVFNITFTARI